MRRRLSRIFYGVASFLTRNAVRLYDRKADPREQNNIAQKRPRVVANLSSRLDQALADFADDELHHGSW